MLPAKLAPIYELLIERMKYFGFPALKFMYSSTRRAVFVLPNNIFVTQFSGTIDLNFYVLHMSAAWQYKGVVTYMNVLFVDPSNAYFQSVTILKKIMLNNQKFFITQLFNTALLNTSYFVRTLTEIRCKVCALFQVNCSCIKCSIDEWYSSLKKQKQYT